jgi:hypothetical protein
MRVLPPGRGVTGPSGDAVFRAAASIALAFLLWAWVTTQRDPPEPRVFADLTLQTPTLPEPLQIAGELRRLRSRSSDRVRWSIGSPAPAYGRRST